MASTRASTRPSRRATPRPPARRCACTLPTAASAGGWRPPWPTAAPEPARSRAVRVRGVHIARAFLRLYDDIQLPIQAQRDHPPTPRRHPVKTPAFLAALLLA